MPEFPLLDLITCHEHLVYEFTPTVLKSIFIQYIFLGKTHTVHSKGFPGDASDKESACNAGDIREAGSLPSQEDSPGKGNGNPFQYSCLENSMDREACQERLFLFLFFFSFSLILSEVERLPTV